MKFSRLRLLLLYTLFCAISLFLYRHCVHAHFLDDSLSAFYDYKLQGPSGFLTSFGFPSMYYGHNLFYFGFYFLFGLNDWAWHFLFISLFCANALLIFICSEALLKKFSFTNSTPAALITCLFFLVSPYQTENMIWAATLHYQISMLCLFTGVWLILRRKKLWPLYLFFAVSLLTHEITFIFPAIWVTVWVFIGRPVVECIKKIIAPHAILILSYFIAMKLIKGYFMPHYGVEHLQGWSPLVVLSTLLKYFFKLLGFVHFFDFATREKIYGWCDNYTHTTIVWVIIASALALLGFKSNYRRQTGLVAMLLVCMFFVLLPVLNMYFMFLSQIENDRLSFFATPFLYLIVAFCITRLPMVVYITISLGILLLMKRLLGLYTWYWINAAEVQQRTLDTYKWFNFKKVYILNLPQNFGGAYIYRKQWRFGSAMLVKNDKNILDQIKAVAGQNMSDIKDGVTVTQLDSVTYDVVRYGNNWFWNGPMGAYSYETDDYALTLNEYSYTLHFKHQPGNGEAIIYQQGGNWKQIYPLTQ